MAKTMNLNDVYRFKACKGEFTFRPADCCDAGLATLFEYGLGRWAQDYANSAAFAYKKATGKEWTDGDRRDAVQKAMESLCKDGTRPGATSADPVLIEAFKLAESDILSAMGAASRKAAMAHPKAGEYFTESASGAVMPKPEGFRAFIEKNDAKRGYMARAKAIVDARADADADVDVDL